MPRKALEKLDRIVETKGPFAAYDEVREACEAHPKSVELKQRMVDAHCQLGAFEEAEALADELIATGHESDGLLRFSAERKRRHALRAEPPDRNARLRAAKNAYEKAQEAHRDTPWHDMQRATFTAVLGEQAEAGKIATKLRTTLADYDTNHDDAVPKSKAWVLAAQGEAAVILDDADEASARYEQLAQVARRSFAWDVVKAARANLRLLLTSEVALDRPALRERDLLDGTLKTPPVALAVGHMLDHEKREQRRFTADMLQPANKAISTFLDRHTPSVGYGSLACGTDILFQEALDRRDVHRFAVLPFPVDAFLRESVIRDDGCGWEGRFRQLWETAWLRHETSPHRFPWDALCYEFGNEVTAGLALLKADEFETHVVGFALWDGNRGDGRGGTESVLRRWQGLSTPIPVELARTQDLAEGDVEPKPLADPLNAPQAFPLEVGNAAVMALLFCDAQGFSGLCENATDKFATKFLKLIADVAAEFDIYERNTWGDAAFFALEDIEAAGDLALKLCEEVHRRRDELVAENLPETLKLRLALHAAPVRLLEDPVRGNQRRVSGAQISTAARIEPITPPGHVFASESFAALSRVREAQAYRCRYLGPADLPKGYGSERVYVLERP